MYDTTSLQQLHILLLLLNQGFEFTASDLCSVLPVHRIAHTKDAPFRSLPLIPSALVTLDLKCEFYIEANGIYFQSDKCMGHWGGWGFFVTGSWLRIKAPGATDHVEASYREEEKGFSSCHLSTPFPFLKKAPGL